MAAAPGVAIPAWCCCIRSLMALHAAPVAVGSLDSTESRCVHAACGFPNCQSCCIGALVCNVLVVGCVHILASVFSLYLCWRLLLSLHAFRLTWPHSNGASFNSASGCPAAGLVSVGLLLAASLQVTAASCQAASHCVVELLPLVPCWSGTDRSLESVWVAVLSWHWRHLCI